MRTCLLVALVLGTVLQGVAGAGQNAPADSARLYIAPTEDGFEAYLTAAMHKKKVPVVIYTAPDRATYTLKASPVEVHKESTGSKVMKCVFSSCADIEDKASTSVTLVDKSGAIVWSYSVNKGRGEKNRQSMAEAIAKHLKDDFLRKRPR